MAPSSAATAATANDEGVHAVHTNVRWRAEGAQTRGDGVLWTLGEGFDSSQTAERTHACSSDPFHTRNAIDPYSLTLANLLFHARPLGAWTDDDGGSDTGTAGEWSDGGGSGTLRNLRAATPGGGAVDGAVGEWVDDSGSEAGGGAAEDAAGEWTDDGGSEAGTAVSEDDGSAVEDAAS